MDQTGIKLLKLMFRPGETVCVSHNKYGYHSIPLENCFSGKVTLVPPNPEHSFEYPETSELKLVALNPIHGFRQDANCTAFRNFLVEMDDGSLDQQLQYIKNLGLPYSACVFSGGKSLHFLISLDTDLPSENVYRMFAEWILAAVTWADQNTKNPSRSIRIPGAVRDDKKQALVDFKGPVSIKDLTNWLMTNYSHLQPKEKEKKEINSSFDISQLRPWAQHMLTFGPDPAKGRNKQWFALACDFALAGYSEDDTMEILKDFFQPDRDFKEREWKTAIKSAYKYIYETRK